MKDAEITKEKVRDLIAHGKTRKALEELILFYKEKDKFIYDQVVLISNSFVTWSQKDKQGLISQAESDIKLNNINNAILAILREESLILDQENLEGAATKYKRYFEELVFEKRQSIKRFNVLSILGVLILVSIFFLPFEKILLNISPNFDSPIPPIKIGFGILTIIPPVWLQSLNKNKRKKIEQICTMISWLSDSKSLTKDLVKKVEEKIIGQIFSSM